MCTSFVSRYGLLERWTPDPALVPPPPAPAAPIGVPDDERVARTQADMAAEAAGYARHAVALGLAPTAPPSEAPGGPAAALSPVFFARIPLDPRQVFYASPSGLTLAIVNLKPLVPGHVLVIPRCGATFVLCIPAHQGQKRTTPS